MRRAAFGLGLLAALGGLACRVTDSIRASDLVHLSMRVERAYEAPLDRLLPAAVAAMDDRKISPIATAVYDSERGSIFDTSTPPNHRGESGGNAAFLAALDPALLRGEIREGGKVRHAATVEVVYRGTIDGQPVSLNLRSTRTGTRAGARVGRRCDKSASEALLDRIETRLAEPAAPPVGR